MSTKAELGLDDLGRARDRGELVEPRVGHGDVADIGLDRAERIVRRLRRRGLGQRIEQRRLADIGKPDDAAFEDPWIAALVESLRKNPGSRRHIFTAWNVDELDQMALPPCHMTYQFHVAEGRLNGLLFQRSCDLGLGFPFNIFGLALLTRMLALHADLEPGEIVWQGGDVHLYLNHANLVETQLAREPAGAPKLHILRKPASIFDHRFEDFSVENYAPQPHIAAPVAV
jgi:thymidylate synthase